ncbi:MAG: VTT domain-containing protein [Aquihabitans sp.]
MGPGHISVLAASFLKPEWWFEQAGAAAIWVVAAMVFAESGMLIGFVFPGDSLLFFTGFLTSDAARNPASPVSPVEHQFATFASHVPALPVVLLIVFVAAVVGDQCGYLIGRKLGPTLFRSGNSRIFRSEHLDSARAFFDRHGPKSIVLARFVPIVRTFTPVVAGAAKMRYRSFVTFNVVGAFLWAIGITSLGHVLGQVDFIRANIEYAVVAVIAVSLAPVAIEVVRGRQRKRPDPIEVSQP